MSINQKEELPTNWVVLRRGRLVYEAIDAEDAFNNVLFEYEEAVCLTDEELDKIRNSSYKE